MSAFGGKADIHYLRECALSEVIDVLPGSGNSARCGLGGSPAGAALDGIRAHRVLRDQVPWRWEAEPDADNVPPNDRASQEGATREIFGADAMASDLETSRCLPIEQ